MSVTAPKGFVASAVHAGIRKNERLDLAVHGGGHGRHITGGDPANSGAGWRDHYQQDRPD